MTSFSAESAHDDPGATHFDAVEAGFACHPECAVAEIARLRAELTREQEAHAQLQARCFNSGPSCTEGVFDEVKTLRAELAEARVGEERYQCLLHNVGLFNDLAKSWSPVINGKLIDYLNLKVAAMVARTTKSSV